MEAEIWKDVNGYKGSYQVSDFGNVKSLAREIYNNRGYFISKEKILKPVPVGKGYLMCILSKDNSQTCKYIHQLVAMAFLGHTPDGHKLVVDHVNGNKLDNRVANLRIVTSRENLSSFRKDACYLTSVFVGVCKSKQCKKWEALISINGKQKRLGSFISEFEASDAYQSVLKQLI